MNDPEDMEALAAQEHESWVGWAKWMLSRIEAESAECYHHNLGPGFRGGTHADLMQKLNALPCMERWRRQMEASYDDLSEEEKESERKVVREKLAIYRPE